MKFCGNCGAKIPDGIKFCPKCGTPVDKFEKQLHNNEQPANNGVNQTQQQQPTIENTQNNSQAPNQNGQFQGQMNNQNQQPNFNGQFQNQSNNFGNHPRNSNNQLMNFLQKYRIPIIVVVLVLIVGGFAFTKSATYNGMTTDDRQKTIELYNASGMFEHMSNSDVVSAQKITTGKDDGDCTIGIDKKKITFRTNNGYDMDNYLMDRDNYGNHEDDQEYIKGIQKASKYALDNWGRGYEISLKDSDGDTYLTYKNGSQTSNHLSDYDDD